MAKLILILNQNKKAEKFCQQLLADLKKQAKKAKFKITSAPLADDYLCMMARSINFNELRKKRGGNHA